jgi:hypothetical protein
MKGRQERRRKIRLWNPSEEDKKKKGRKKAIEPRHGELIYMCHNLIAIFI